MLNYSILDVKTQYFLVLNS